VYPVFFSRTYSVDTEGLQALSMRHLAHSLNREAMTLYRYAANKTALLDGVVELVLRELHINAAAEDWRQELRTLAHDFRDLARAHPNVLPLVVTRPLATPLGLRPPGTLRPLEDFLQLLTRAGFTTTNALHAYRLFFGFLHGHVLAELQEHVTNPEDTEDLLRLGLHRLSPEKFPNYAPSAPHSPATTPPPSSTSVSTSCSPGSPPTSSPHHLTPHPPKAR